MGILTAKTNPTCPRCNLPLKQVRTEMGMFWGCDQCSGRAITVELLRRIFTPESINPLWRHAIKGQGVSGRLCPDCRRAMTEVDLSDNITIKVDVCQRCHFVWFDAGETQTLVPRPLAEKKLPVPPKARETIALFEVDRLAREAQRSDVSDYAPGPWWAKIAALFLTS